MKKIFNVFATTLVGVFAISMTACEKPQPTAVAVESVTLNESAYTLVEGKTFQLVAEVLPEKANQAVTYESDNEAAAIVDEDGLVTAVKAGVGTATITVTADGGETDVCVFTIEADEHPVLGKITFKTAQTWKVGDQEWSDVVMVSAARGKTTYNGGDTNGYFADFRENEGYGDMFSYEAVNQYGDALCPGEWNVPTKDDFIALDKAMGGDGTNRWAESNVEIINTYWLGNTWGGSLAGRIEWGSLASDTKWGHYWALGEYPDGTYGNSYSLSLSWDGEINPQMAAFKPNGFQVRCVK